MNTTQDIPTPLASYSGEVQPEWIDDNNHMNVAYYVLAFDYATDALFNFLGLSRAYKDANNVSTFAVDMNVVYKRELRLGEPLRIETRMIDFSDKALHYFHEMYHGDEGYLAASNEVLSMHMDMNIRRIAPMADEIQQWVKQVHQAHSALERPKSVGRVLGVRR
ncbi:MAG TPA: thioesterase-like protein [Rhodospirillaceae bacterium]|nr:thioesterase-like protein [Rhodospirillaceae bacterium]HAA93222.1 thioesterase-like protein [Rhodospirillaceae bacterium]HAT35694.1 thioesterase-like protein [Rhodospirillaceae bacterium]|tara:strand:+ start:90 stop:581 length:492 start_codon:yes stop_codon:yes gene_type:complete